MEKIFHGLGYKRITTKIRSCQIRQLLILGLMLISIFVLLFEGCKKNNPTAPVEQNILQGNQAFHASAVASYQSVGAGVAYPFKALELSSPTGSPIHSKAIVNNLLHSFGPSLNKSNNSLADSIYFFSNLNLYGEVQHNGNIYTIAFYTDAAATQSAGSAKLTLPTNITNPTDPTSYASYPANILMEINVTAGNLPCKGSVQIVFAGQSGANTMTGTNTLTRDNVEFTLNLGLDDNLNTSGSITIKESGATISATNVNGFVFDTLNCDASISPYNWAGIGKINLLTGSVSINVNTGSGNSSC